MGWFAALAVAGFICWAVLDVARTLRKRRVEDSRPVYQPTHVWQVDSPPEFYDQEEER